MELRHAIELKDDTDNITTINVKYPICSKLLNVHYSQWTAHLIRHQKAHNKGQGDNWIIVNIFSQTFLSIKVIKYDPFTTVKNHNSIEMLRECYNPSFQNFSC